MRIILVLELFCLLAGCTTTRYVPVPEYHTRDGLVVRTQRDSIFLHDSIFQSIYMKGDTVFSVKVKTQWKFRDRIQHDTVLSVRIDSMRFFYPQESGKGCHAMRWYERLLMRFGAVCTLAAFALAVTYLVKRRSK